MIRIAAIGVVVCSFLIPAYGQQQTDENRAFHAARYPADKFIVTQSDLPLGDVSVRIIQAKGRSFVQQPTYCSAWVEVRRGDAIVKQISFLDIEPVGYSFGLFLPRRQPIRDALVIMKEGDYDGRMLIISTDGTISDLPGGLYFETDDERYLVGLHMQDDVELIVVDTKSRALVLDQSAVEDPGEIADFYRSLGAYYFTMLGADEKAIDAAYRLDFARRRVVKEPSLSSQNSRRLGWDFSPSDMPDCTTK